MIRVCLIGVSGYGNTHYRRLIELNDAGRVAIAAATVVNQAEEAEKCRALSDRGAHIFDDYREMLREFAGEAALCCIPTGIHLHAEMTVAALGAGMNVLVEKPAAATVSDVELMRKASEEAGRFVAVGYQSMYAAETPAMKRAILDGEIGRLLTVKYVGLGARTTAYYGRNSWAGRLRANGKLVLDSPFNNAHAHRTNMIAFLAGAEEGLSASPTAVRAELYRANAIESPDTATLEADTREGVKLFFATTHAPETAERTEVVAVGEQGRLIWRIHGAVTLEREGCGVRELPRDTGPQSEARMFDAVVRRAGGENVRICGLDVAGTQTILAHAAHESSPVVPVPAEFVRRELGRDGTDRMVIDGIDEMMERAFDEEAHLSGLGAPWAKTGDRVDVAEFLSGAESPDWAPR